jgi:DNA-binding NarL/FixJ family response regulator
MGPIERLPPLVHWSLALVPSSAEAVPSIGSLPRHESEALSRLTDSERAVALCLVQGASNGEVSRQRDTSERTVANQAQSIY